jgi:hypothetical protein
MSIWTDLLLFHGYIAPRIALELVTHAPAPAATPRAGALERGTRRPVAERLDAHHVARPDDLEKFTASPPVPVAPVGCR